MDLSLEEGCVWFVFKVVWTFLFRLLLLGNNCRGELVVERLRFLYTSSCFDQPFPSAT